MVIPKQSVFIVSPIGRCSFTKPVETLKYRSDEAQMEKVHFQIKNATGTL